jgi:membrane fusion protein, multidrug efflux system
MAQETFVESKPQQSAPEAGAAQPKKNNKTFIIVLGLLVVVGGYFGVSSYLHGLRHEETDDAQIDASISPVIPRISGYVAKVCVKDNQSVKKGDTLVILDSKNEQIALSQMQAALNSARSNKEVAGATTIATEANVTTFKANALTVDAQIEAAKVTLHRASQDYERYYNLYQDHSVPRIQLDQADAAKQSAEKQLKVLQEQKDAILKQANAANSQTTVASRQVNVAAATIEQRMADYQNALLNLSYTVITAPEDGTISKVNIQVGQYLQMGQTIFNIVLDTNPWVTANFKETQVAKMRIGQKVFVHVDAFPGQEFEAKIASFSPATGAKFALLPPDNASGNFVKVVQRLPVRIEFSKESPLIKELRPGMNVDVDVNIE